MAGWEMRRHQSCGLQSLLSGWDKIGISDWLFLKQTLKETPGNILNVSCVVCDQEVIVLLKTLVTTLLNESKTFTESPNEPSFSALNSTCVFLKGCEWDLDVIPAYKSKAQFPFHHTDTATQTPHPHTDTHTEVFPPLPSGMWDKPKPGLASGSPGRLQSWWVTAAAAVVY